MIVLTGAAGFIGSAMAGTLNQAGYEDLVLVDDFSRPDRKANYEEKTYTQLLPREELDSWMKQHGTRVQAVLHLGARTDTSEQDVALFERLNVEYSKMVWRHCTDLQLPLLYASSAATYGAGEQGYSDSHEQIPKLEPLNPYGRSKQLFDLWVLEQAEQGNAPFFWAGFKFFNVYGPNEYHKGRMASVIFHAYNQIQKNGELKLFMSHRDDYAHGEQKRDFVYVKDLCNVLLHFMENRQHPAIYNLGSGTARTFNDLGKSVFGALGLETQISYIPTPVDIRDSYQYFTEADLSKLRAAGYSQAFTPLEEGAKDYVQNFLVGKSYL